jgi:acylglycerol lipase
VNASQFLAGHSLGGLVSLMSLEADQNRPDIPGLLLLSAAVKIHPDAGPNWLVALAKLGGCLTPWFKPPRTFGVEMVCRNKVYFFRALDFETFFQENHSWLEEQGEDYGDNGGPNLGKKFSI